MQTDGVTVGPPEATLMTYRDAVAAAMADEMRERPEVVLLGEDVASSGGVHKTNSGLLEEFGADRVLNTPICENTFVGVGLGMAVTGMRPIVEIMFSDFLPVAGDAVVNELPKFRFMSGGQCAVPVTVRAIGGGTRRMGSQHSATGESWYIDLPGLKVATASTASMVYGVLRAAIRDDNPVLVFEHKALYGREAPVVRDASSIAEVGRAAVIRRGTDITVIATMLMADRAAASADELSAEGISAEVIDPVWLRPIDMETITQSARRTNSLLIVEEQVHAGGWGASVISRLALAGQLPATVGALSLDDELPMPSSAALEDAMIPSVERVTAAIRDQVLRSRSD